MTRLLHRLYLWLTAQPHDHVSADWLQQHARAATTRGVDLPRWRLPRERGQS